MNLIHDLVEFANELKNSDKGKNVIVYKEKVDKLYNELSDKKKYILNHFFLNINDLFFYYPYNTIKCFKKYNGDEKDISKEDIEDIISNENVKGYADCMKNLGDFVDEYIRKSLYADANILSMQITGKIKHLFYNLSYSIARVYTFSNIKHITNDFNLINRYETMRRKYFPEGLYYSPYHLNKTNDFINQAKKENINIGNFVETINFIIYICNSVIYQAFLFDIEEINVIDIETYKINEKTIPYVKIKSDSVIIAFDDGCCIYKLNDGSYFFCDKKSVSIGNKIEGTLQGFVYPENDTDLFNNVSIIESLENKVKCEMEED